MKTPLASLVLVAASTCWAANGWAPPPEAVVEANARPLRGKPPREIARFLYHPYSPAAAGAAKALAECGEKAIPLVAKLFSDAHPGIRAGAVRTLATMVASLPEGRKLSPGLKKALAEAVKLTADRSPGVQGALGELARSMPIETPEVHKIALVMAASDDPGVRAAALNIGRHKIEDPKVKARIGMAVSAHHKGNTPRHYGLAHLLLQQGIEHARPAIPTLGRFFDEVAPTLRRMFSDGAQYRALDVIEHYQSEGLAKVPGLVRGLCKCYVRVPRHGYPGWVRTEKQLKRILWKLGPDAAPAIRQALEADRKWLAEATADELKRLETNKENCQKALDELAALRLTLETRK